MTIKELLIACGDGEFPAVTVDKLFRHSNSLNGVVTEIKKHGCFVKFDNMAKSVFFWANDSNVGWYEYMSQLSLKHPDKDQELKKVIAESIIHERNEGHVICMIRKDGKLTRLDWPSLDYKEDEKLINRWGAFSKLPLNFEKP